MVLNCCDYLWKINGHIQTTFDMNEAAKGHVVIISCHATGGESMSQDEEVLQLHRQYFCNLIMEGYIMHGVKSKVSHNAHNTGCGKIMFMDQISSSIGMIGSSKLEVRKVKNRTDGTKNHSTLILA
jgi:hypothetical protein